MRTMNTTWSCLDSTLIKMTCTDILLWNTTRTCKNVLDTRLGMPSDLHANVSLYFCFISLTTASAWYCLWLGENRLLLRIFFPRPFFPLCNFLCFFFLPVLHIIHTHKTTTGAVIFPARSYDMTIFVFNKPGKLKECNFWEYGSGVYFIYFLFWMTGYWHAIYLSTLTFLDILWLMYHGPTEIAIWHDLSHHHPKKRSEKNQTRFRSIAGRAMTFHLLVLVSAKGPRSSIKRRTCYVADWCQVVPDPKDRSSPRQGPLTLARWQCRRQFCVVLG